jgi:cytochrome o ubiquinol oxidase subunit 3
MIHSSASLVEEVEVRRWIEERDLGFWIYLLSDAIIFGLLFATYLIMVDGTAGGPAAHDLFHLKSVFVETATLLLSSTTFGLASGRMAEGRWQSALRWLALTFSLGLTFVVMEVLEFRDLLGRGAGPDRSGFLSAFFTLVGIHGLHVAVGMLWIVVFGIDLSMRGISPMAASRLSRLAMFWHFLDVIWIGIFSVVYLPSLY